MISEAAIAENVHAAMSVPGFYPGAPEGVVVRETHISWVFPAAKLARGELKQGAVVDVARLLARLHAQAPSVASAERRMVPKRRSDVRAL